MSFRSAPQLCTYPSTTTGTSDICLPKRSEVCIAALFTGLRAGFELPLRGGATGQYLEPARASIAVNELVHWI